MLLGIPGDPSAPKLLLIKSRVDNAYSEACAPALGVMYLGATARAAGWNVRAIDTWLEDEPEHTIREALREFPADVVGLSALTSESRAMHRFAKVAREAAPGALVVAGGPHPSAYEDETLEDESIDLVVVGEGEATLRELLGRLERRERWDDIAGTVVRDASGKARRNAPRPYIEDLDSLPMPAWDLTDVEAFAKRRGMSLAGKRRYMPIMTSRGCPYRCTYCHDIQGKRFRAHSPSYVLEMIDGIERQLGVRHFDIIDDIFNFDAKRMQEICERILERPTPIGFTFPNGIRADRMTPEQADMLARAGCEYVAVAIESANKHIQKQIRKHLRFDKVLPVIEAFTQRGVFTCGFFMIGFPGETESDIRATISFAAESKLHSAFFFVVTPFQGTQLHDQTADHLGVDVRQLTELYVRQRVNLSAVPSERFAGLRRLAYTRFYFDPTRVVRILREFPRPRYLAELGAVMIVRDTLRLSPGRVLEPLVRTRGRARRALKRLMHGNAASNPPAPSVLRPREHAPSEVAGSADLGPARRVLPVIGTEPAENASLDAE